MKRKIKAEHFSSPGGGRGGGAEGSIYMEIISRLRRDPALNRRDPVWSGRDERRPGLM